jgi:hypothetical protein
MASETSPSKFLFRFLRILDVKTLIGLCIFVLQRRYQCGLDCRKKMTQKTLIMMPENSHHECSRNWYRILFEIVLVVVARTINI